MRDLASDIARLLLSIGLVLALMSCGSEEQPVSNPETEERTVASQMYEAMLPTSPFGSSFDQFRAGFDAYATRIGGDPMVRCVPHAASPATVAVCTFAVDGFARISPSEAEQLTEQGLIGLDDTVEITSNTSGLLLRVQLVGDSSTAARRTHYRLQIIAMMMALGASDEQATQAADELDLTAPRTSDRSVETSYPFASLSCFQGAVPDFPAINCILEPPRQ